MWRCRGRLGNVDLQYHTKYLVLLPGKHYFTELIIRRAHKRVGHNGTKETITEVRANFWIIRERVVVRKIIHKRVICQKQEGRPYNTLEPPPLPAFHVTAIYIYRSRLCGTTVCERRNRNQGLDLFIHLLRDAHYSY